jgi:hypothetical protein
MGFLDSIFGKTHKINHDFFGEMIFEGGKRPKPSDYFECSRHFKPSDKLIQIGIDGNISGPTQKQVDFFRSIEDHYAQIVTTVIPLIEEEFGNWKAGFTIVDFRKEFEPIYLRIPRCESIPIIWEISFESDHERDHIFTLTMKDFQAKEILIDG